VSKEFFSGGCKRGYKMPPAESGYLSPRSTPRYRYRGLICSITREGRPPLREDAENWLVPLFSHAHFPHGGSVKHQPKPL